MLLECLLKLVETLRGRMDAHGDALRQSEALTRYALIDPLLRELGWDTADPAQVVPEYRVPNNQMADYVLLANGAPVIVVESKKLDEPLRGGKALDQGILYCAHTSSGYFLLTDGRRWELYEASKTVPRISFDLKSQSPAEACLEALALWQPSVASGHVAVAQAPVAGMIQDPPSPPEPPTPDPQPTIRDPDEHEWQLLTEVTATKGMNPIEVLLPDGRTIQVKNWGATLEQAVRWLTDKGLLQSGHCPIVGSNPRAFRYMVHTQPIHSNGDRFKYPTKVNGLWVEKHDNHHALITKTKTIIKHVGQDPAQFKVRFS